MRKIFMILSIALVGLTSCGSGTQGETPKTDSTAVDTVKVVVDTTKAPVDTVKK